MLDIFLTYLTYLLVIAGAFFCISGAIGVLRMPDLFTRLHPAGVIDVAGVQSILLSLIISYGFTLLSFKLMILMLILLITSPTATHIIASLSLGAGITPKEINGTYK